MLAIDLIPNNSTKEDCFLYLSNLGEHRSKANIVNETHKKWVKVHYDCSIDPHVFLQGDLVLFYDQDREKLGETKFEPLCNGPNVIKWVLQKWAHELEDYDGNPLSEP